MLEWYPFYVLTYQRDTRKLTPAQDGIYRRLIDEYMLFRDPLPDDDAALAGIARITLEEWLAVAPVIRAFFHAEQGKLTHKRCEQELHAQAMQTHKRSKQAKGAAEVRWTKYRELKAINAPALPLQSPRNAGAMLKDATLQDKDRIPSISARPDPSAVDCGEKSQSQNNTARSLATALPAGALAREPSTEQAAPIESGQPSADVDKSSEPPPTPSPRPQNASRADLERIYSRRKTGADA